MKRRVATAAAVFLMAAGSATALGADDISNLSANNVQLGDNSSNILQNTDAASGDAVGGQVVGGRSGGPSDIVVANKKGAFVFVQETETTD